VEAAARAQKGSRKDFIKQVDLEDISDNYGMIKDFSYSYMNQCTMIIFGMMRIVIICCGVSWQQLRLL